MSDAKTLIAQARRAERSVPVCLRADLSERYQALERDRRLAEAEDGESLAGSSRAHAIAEQMEAVRQDMFAATVDFKLRAVPRRRWTQLVAEHPPREGREADKLLGVNEETFFEQLLRECVVEPQLDAEDWQRLLDEALSQASWEALTASAWAVNARDVDVPFSRGASQTLRSSENA